MLSKMRAAIRSMILACIVGGIIAGLALWYIVTVPEGEWADKEEGR
jgi:uncharacterized membrane protein YccC